MLNLQKPNLRWVSCAKFLTAMREMKCLSPNCHNASSLRTCHPWDGQACCPLTVPLKLCLLWVYASAAVLDSQRSPPPMAGSITTTSCAHVLQDAAPMQPTCQALAASDLRLVGALDDLHCQGLPSWRMDNASECSWLWNDHP